MLKAAATVFVAATLIFFLNEPGCLRIKEDRIGGKECDNVFLLIGKWDFNKIEFPVK